MSISDAFHNLQRRATGNPFATGGPPGMMAALPPLRIAILYATMSGNAETLAGLTASRFERFGVLTEPSNCADVHASLLEEIDVAILIASTWGDGQPPIDARDFFTELADPAAPNLGGLNYAVLALGNKTYTDFCAFGREVDETLARRGAKRLLERVECDQWLRAPFEAWLEHIADKVEDLA